MEDKKVIDALEAYKAEAVKNLVNAFNEGFMLGKEHAERIYGKK